MKEESVSNMVKQMGNALRSMVKRKARALKARLIIYSLLAQSNFFVSSSIPLTTISTHHHNQQHSQLQAVVEDHQVAETQQETERETGVCTKYEEAEAEAEAPASGSVIEMVKNSKEKAGEEFSLEKDIDHVADLFIRNFHQQMRMQKQNSLNRSHQELLFR
ncbi:uncharacterized protein LOC105434868 [Cucumis sativus]|uniref:DUF4408 domain-containing protein n=1 Tax=Cucumis sativus TaxID=3659 RepID=A0A0A0LCA7_CUCSA|nr:uncharacterized protein LOC105434868 [Cucumis sativus]KGN57686.1 hypothetical protein Csa_009867 [Cucumis sativus]